MKLHLSQTAGIHLISAYGEGFVEVGHRRLAGSVVLLPDHIHDWQVAGFDDLKPEHLSALLEYRPELVLLGTGSRLRLPSPALYAGLLAERIGLEAMDLGAACRTYNLLAGEGRRVAAALIV
ncbi:MAG: Mth938-like domain-containing protein [Betaproteobacteria bacterium]|nr:Mth938-like domain-containing protein [Betaproteobacteria bacterium]